MDPLTHTLLACKIVAKKPVYLLLANVPDLPFYIVYPAWVLARGELQVALKNDDWPKPPRWLEVTHHALHSIPVGVGVGLALRLRHGRWPRKLLATWLLHILVDIPTHSRAQWGPRFLWPFSDYAFDGVSWVSVLTRLFSHLWEHRIAF